MAVTNTSDLEMFRRVSSSHLDACGQISDAHVRQYIATMEGGMQLSIHKIYDIANRANPKTDYHPPSAVVAAAGSAGATASADQSWLAVLSADQSMAIC